jgi:hypothetical protein
VGSRALIPAAGQRLRHAASLDGASSRHPRHGAPGRAQRELPSAGADSPARRVGLCAGWDPVTVPPATASTSAVKTRSASSLRRRPPQSARKCAITASSALATCTAWAAANISMMAPITLSCAGLRPQLSALFTSALIRASSSAVNSFRAKSVGHMVPSSRFALSLKPSVAYRMLYFSALLKKQTILPSLA